MIGLSIDPGKSTGICLFRYDENGFSIIKRWQFSGGADMLDRWLDGVQLEPSENGEMTMVLEGEAFVVDALVVEKFTPHENEGFSLTLDSVEPLVCEGVLVAHKMKRFIQWGQPSQQYFMGDPRMTKVQKRKAAKVFLETHGLLPTGAEFGQPDAEDAISATLHAIAFLRRRRHMPTMVQLFSNNP